MKQTLLLIFIITFLACETAEEKKERQFKEKVFKSDYLHKGILEMVTFEGNLKGAQDGYLSTEKCIDDYNRYFGFAMGYTNNLDSIAAYMDSKKPLYESYLVKDAFWWFSRDTIEAAKYKREKDSILQLLK